MKRYLSLPIAFVALLIFSAIPKLTDAQTVSANVLQRVFQLRCNEQIGTTFTMDVGGRQYLITTRHLVDSLKDNGDVDIRRETDWVRTPVKAFFPSEESLDIAVLAPNRRISSTHPFPAATGNFSLSQEVYFLGFPSGLSIDSKKLNAGFPLPFVKKGNIAALVHTEAGAQIIVVDALNNPGFAGGPLLYQYSATHELGVAGVVSGYKFQEDKVLDGSRDTTMSARDNSGLLVAYSIKIAMDVIRDHPVGADLSLEP